MNAPVETLISVANFLVAAGTLALTFRKVQMEQQSRGREAEEKKSRHGLWIGSPKLSKQSRMVMRIRAK